MGLPIYRDPPAEDSRIKQDPLSSARSTIRRSRSNRHARVREHPSASVSVSASAAAPSGPTRLHSSGIDAPSNQLVRLRDGPNFAGISTRDAPSPFPLPTAPEVIMADADRARAEVSNRRRMENGRALLRDALSYERPRALLARPYNQPDGRASPLPRVPESRDYISVRSPATFSDSWERLNEQNPRASDPALGHTVPRPDLPAGDAVLAPPTSAIARTSLGSASYTPGFAPAHRFDTQSPDPHRRSTSRSASRPHDSAEDVTYALDDANTAEALTASLPRLRRMGRRSILEGMHRARLSSRGSFRDRDSQPATATATATAAVDGLGDRQRSLSPDDSWETLLTTIAPDTQLPSAHSSFTSATASASATSSLASSHANSANTSITAPDDYDDDDEVDGEEHVCVVLSSESDASGTDVDASSSDDASSIASDADADADADAPQHSQPQPVLFHDDLLHHHHHHHPHHGRHHHRHRHHHHHNRHNHQQHPPTVPAISSFSTSTSPLTDDPSLANMHGILARLANREDIPDEWWAAAGLSRNLQVMGERRRRGGGGGGGAASPEGRGGSL